MRLDDIEQKSIMAMLNLVEATIDDLQSALTSGTISSVELVARYLRRIIAYDCLDTALNSIPNLNPNIFDEAAASDDRRAAGCSVRLLEGIPYTVKDSFSVRGMTVACGSPAFEKLVASHDAFTVSAIRNAGGVLVGRTNMPPMAYGGMQRGIYGRAESPYNPNYLAAAFWSGSSNGSAVSTAASFSTFGMGEETVSSGRSPASNNALVAYTPSRGCLSIRGNWPLYPTCDVVVPQTRSMADMLRLLEVIAAQDLVTRGDFWRDQPFVELKRPWVDGPRFCDVSQHKSMSGVRIAVPEMYIGGPSPAGAQAVTVSPEVVELWRQAQQDLESLGAEIVIVPDFPLVTAYENPDLSPSGCPRRPDDWHSSERGPLIAHGWNEFLQHNNDPNFPDLASVDPFTIYPESYRTQAELTVIDRSNAIRFSELAHYIAQASLYDTPRLGSALVALEGMRKHLLEMWLDSLGCHCVVFPAVGDVGAANADVDEKSAAYAWRNGVFYSNGNKALRHLGVPSVTIPMGTMRSKRMPVGLTFAGKAYDDINLLSYGNAYENATQHRTPPPLTPAIPSDLIDLTGDASKNTLPRPTLVVDQSSLVLRSEDAQVVSLHIAGTVTTNKPCNDIDSPVIEISVNNDDINAEDIKVELQHHAESTSTYRFAAKIATKRPTVPEQRLQTSAPVTKDAIIVVVLARASANGRPSGWLSIL